jgi:hypothetical protein
VTLDRLAHRPLVDPEIREQRGGFIVLGEREQKVPEIELRAPVRAPTPA